MLFKHFSKLAKVLIVFLIMNFSVFRCSADYKFIVTLDKYNICRMTIVDMEERQLIVLDAPVLLPAALGFLADFEPESVESNFNRSFMQSVYRVPATFKEDMCRFLFEQRCKLAQYENHSTYVNHDSAETESIGSSDGTNSDNASDGSDMSSVSDESFEQEENFSDENEEIIEIKQMEIEDPV